MTKRNAIWVRTQGSKIEYKPNNEGLPRPAWDTIYLRMDRESAQKYLDEPACVVLGSNGTCYVSVPWGVLLDNGWESDYYDHLEMVGQTAKHVPMCAVKVISAASEGIIEGDGLYVVHDYYGLGLPPADDSEMRVIVPREMDDNTFLGTLGKYGSVQSRVLENLGSKVKDLNDTEDFIFANLACAKAGIFPENACATQVVVGTNQALRAWTQYRHNEVSEAIDNALNSNAIEYV